MFITGQTALMIDAWLSHQAACDSLIRWYKVPPQTTMYAPPSSGLSQWEILIQKIWRSDIFWKSSRPLSLVLSNLVCSKLMYLVYLQTGLRSTPSQYGGHYGWEVMLKLLWKLRQVIMHQLWERRPWTSSFNSFANVWNVHSFLNSSLAFNAASHSVGHTWTYLSDLNWQTEFAEQAEHITWFSFVTYSVSLKCATRGDCFAQEISGVALVTQKLWPVSYL